MNTLQSAFFAGANVVWQSAGWLEGGLVTSLAKFVADVELLDLLLHAVHAARGRRGEPRASAPTSRSATAATSSAPSTRSSASASASGGRRSRRPRTSTAGRAAAALDHAARAERACAELLESYERPPLDDAIEEELVEFVERRAVELGDPLQVARA